MIKRNQNITGMKFGKLTVLERDYEYEQTHGTNSSYWKCQCDCGKIKTIRRASLINGDTQSCGCMRAKDLIGQKFGRLTVIKRVPNKNKKVCWKCRCDCGNVVIVDAGSLLSGNTKSCGCLRQQTTHNINYEDLTGQRFGHLVVIHQVNDKLYSNKHILWKCQCDCGNIIEVDSSRLKTGHTQSCGCIKMSHGEEKIQQILEENNIKYIYNKGIFKDLKSTNNRVLRYDFILLDDNQIPFRLVEFDGQQHFETIPFFERSHNNSNMERDKIKNNYALNNNIPLVRIPYTKEKTLCLQDILGDEFLIKGENYESNDI